MDYKFTKLRHSAKINGKNSNTELICINIEHVIPSVSIQATTLVRDLENQLKIIEKICYKYSNFPLNYNLQNKSKKGKFVSRVSVSVYEGH